MKAIASDKKIRFYDDITVSDELSIRRAQKPRIIPDDQNIEASANIRKKKLYDYDHDASQ